MGFAPGGQRNHPVVEPLATRVIRRRWREAFARQYLAARLLDELELHVVPVVLGGGAGLFDNLGDADVELEQVRAVEAPGVAHLKYRFVT